MKEQHIKDLEILNSEVFTKLTTNQDRWDFDEQSQVYKSQPLDKATALNLLAELQKAPFGQRFNPLRTLIEKSSTPGMFKVTTRCDYVHLEHDLQVSYEAKNQGSKTMPPLSAPTVSIFTSSEPKKDAEDIKDTGMKPPAR